jgi:ABC-type lipoprotein export system ATPase subunit
MQKIAFVRALLSNIEILILDESTANLDKESTLKIFHLLQEKKVTIINSTHDPQKFLDVDKEIRIVIQDETRFIEIHEKKS